MKKIKIYFSGRMENLLDKGNSWRVEILKRILAEVPDVEYGGPSIEDTENIVEREIEQIRNADLILVNASIEVVFGAPMEIVIAKYSHKPVLTLIGDPSPYCINGKIHPWLKAFSDYTACSINEVAKLIKQFSHNGEIKCRINWDDIVTQTPRTEEENGNI